MEIVSSGVDDETWLYHLKRNDYINWFRKSVKDESLANSAEKIEDEYPDAQDSRNAIFKLIRERYTSAA
jgi:hypothetical protein